jgi:hypothetical protein
MMSALPSVIGWQNLQQKLEPGVDAYVIAGRLTKQFRFARCGEKIKIGLFRADPLSKSWLALDFRMLAKRAKAP